MSSLTGISRSNFFIRLRNWEYWPFGIVQFPVFFYWLWLSLRCRSLTFFSASNPGIVMGGMFGESKYDVIKKLPAHLVPKTILITVPNTSDNVVRILQENGFSFPVIFKPELGERGYMVRKISAVDQIDKYLMKIRSSFLVQEFIDMPHEFGVFYTRFPADNEGVVTSIVMKEMLSVTGDGTSTLKELIMKKARARLQWRKLQIIYQDRLEEILQQGKSLELVNIGNHAQGTKFLDGSYLINEQLSRAFDQISQQVEGFYFGRYDVRCGAVEDLYNGNVKILELNGCGAEPGHIYDPNFPLFKAVRVLLSHWRNIFEIARQNRSRGVKYISFREAYLLYRQFKSATSG